MTVVDDMKFILASTAYYSPDSTPEMTARGHAVKSMAEKVRAWLPPELQIADETATPEVDYGGQRGGISPVPWVRIFARQYSPSATAGFYLVYLFAGDGSKVYLSLNQGTSEFRAGKFRPMVDTDAIRAQSQETRDLFAGWSPELLRGLASDVDLGVSALAVGNQSKKSAANYEAANVFAVCYEANRLPPDQLLREDLTRMLGLLSHVYCATSRPNGVTATETAVVSRKTLNGNSHQASVADSQLRKAIEDYSLKVVKDTYNTTGLWDIQDVSKYRSWHLELTSRGDRNLVVRVTVKGTASDGTSVILTDSEVKAAREYSHTVLVIVHSVRVAVDTEQNLVCTGGVMRKFDFWTPADDHLAPIHYRYRVPAGGESHSLA